MNTKQEISCISNEEEDDLTINSDCEASIILNIDEDELLKEPDSSPTQVEKDADQDKNAENNKEGGTRHLWVCGLDKNTRAKDLKQLFLKHAKVVAAKVMMNARTPDSRCYGYVTLENARDVKYCIMFLHGSMLHGRKISVEKARSEPESSSRRQTSRSEHRSSKEEKEENEVGKDKRKKDGTETNRSTSQTRDKTHKTDKERSRRLSRNHDRPRSSKELQHSALNVERARVRAAREVQRRRRRAAQDALRERERRQRLDQHRLAVEREKLRAEREKIERERNELLRLERERHRLEREKLELERLELKRAQLRLEEERRKTYRKPATSLPVPAYEGDRHKRAPPASIQTSSRGFLEPHPPPRFGLSSNYSRIPDKRYRDYKRDYPRNVPSTTNEVSRLPVPPTAKEPSRAYDSRDNRSNRPPGSGRYPNIPGPSKGSGGGGPAWAINDPRYASGGRGGYDPRLPSAYQPSPLPARSAYSGRSGPAREYRKY